MGTSTMEWEIQHYERPRAFAAFARYRDMGSERSLEKLRREMGAEAPSLRSLKRWSSRHQWVERCQAFDASLDRRMRLQHERDLLRTREVHLSVARAVIAHLVPAINALSTQTLRPMEIARLFEVATAIERAALGVAQKLEISGPEGRPIFADRSQSDPEAIRAEMVRVLMEMGHPEEESEKLADFILTPPGGVTKVM